MEVNQCDVRCPRKAYTLARYEEDSVDARAIRRAAAVVTVGIIGVGCALRASVCPQRNESSHEWRPQPTCAEAVTQAMQEHPLQLARMSAYERQILEPYIPPADSDS